MENRNLWILSGPGYTRPGAFTIRHESIIEEVSQVPVLTKEPGPKIFQVVDVKVAGEMQPRHLPWHLTEIIFL